MNRTPRAMGRHGAMPAGAPMGMKTNPMKTIKRLLKYMTAYKVRLIFVLVCIVFSAGAGVASSLFIQILIDNYITPLMVANEKDFGGLLMAIIMMAVLLTFGALCLNAKPCPAVSAIQLLSSISFYCCNYLLSLSPLSALLSLLLPPWLPS